MRISGTRLARGTRLTPVLAIMLAGAMAVVGLQLGVGPAQALTAVSPATAGFGPKGVTLPQWYADASGVRLQPCLLGPPRCFTAAANFVPDTGEAFYFLADANLNTTGHGATPGAAAPASLLRIGLEAGFVPAGTNNPSVFSRVRFRIGVPTPGTYTVTYPFGQKTFTVNALGTPGRDINDTTDSGAFATNATPANFALATGPCPAGGCTQGGPGSPIEPFLEWDGTAPAPPVGFLSDGVTPHGVTGSPTGDNLFRIEGPGINPNPADPTTACTPPALAGPDCVQTTLFKVFAQRAPGLSAGPNALSFPAQAMGTTAPAQVVTLTNTSADPITVSTALTGPQAAEFSATPAGGAPCAGASATLAAGGRGLHAEPELDRAGHPGHQRRGHARHRRGSGRGGGRGPERLHPARHAHGHARPGHLRRAPGGEPAHQLAGGQPPLHPGRDHAHARQRHLRLADPGDHDPDPQGHHRLGRGPAEPGGELRLHHRPGRGLPAHHPRPHPRHPCGPGRPPGQARAHGHA